MTQIDNRFRKVNLTEEITDIHAHKFFGWVKVYAADIISGTIRKIDCAKIVASLLMIPSTSTLNLAGAVVYIDNSDGEDKFSFKLILPNLIEEREIPEELKSQVADSIFSLHLALRSLISQSDPDEALFVTKFFQQLADRLEVDRHAAGLGSAEA